VPPLFGLEPPWSLKSVSPLHYGPARLAGLRSGDLDLRSCAFLRAPGLLSMVLASLSGMPEKTML